MTQRRQVCLDIPMTDRDTQQDGPLLVPIGRAAEILGVSVETIRRWEKQGKITATRTLGGQRRFRSDDLERIAKAGAA